MTSFTVLVNNCNCFHILYCRLILSLLDSFLYRNYWLPCFKHSFEIVPQEVLWSIWGSHQTLCSPPLPNVRWHSGTWPYTMTPSIDQILHQFATLLPNLTLLLILTLLPNFGGFHRTLQRVRLANRGRLLLRTPGPVPFGTCICSNVETILSWTCHVYGPFEFRTSLDTSILLSKCQISDKYQTKKTHWNTPYCNYKQSLQVTLHQPRYGQLLRPNIGAALH